MYTSNNQNSSRLIYNGPHIIRSTSPMGFSVTARNIPFEKKYVEVPNENLFPFVDNISEISIDRKQEQGRKGFGTQD